MKFTHPIEGPIFIGRSWAEYLKMFDLDLDYLENKNILDCAAGASSFTSYMCKNGFKCTAVDMLYDEDPEFLQNRCINHLKILISSINKIKNEFVWNFFKDLEHLKKHRIGSCRDFTRDYRKWNGKKYLKADLTQLPFLDNSFDLVLCAHLLFIYDHRLDLDFHKKAVNEMIRVSRKEVKIYPLVKHRGIRSFFVDKIMESLPMNVDAEIVKVDYQFRQGGDEMLRLSKNE